jgi:8-oxo-dGTP pyrophosphatase MutT (NUDIX family)
VEERIRKAVSRRKAERIVEGGLKASAVLIPICRGNGEYHVLFTQRSDEVVFHRGQVCFPGGTREPSDRTLLQTALRESEEEVGLQAEDVEILGELDDIPTFTSNYVISPFVALISHPRSLRTNDREVRGTFCVPLSFLMDEANFKRDSYSYEYDGHIIWGATARIVRQFTDLLKGGDGGAE